MHVFHFIRFGKGRKGVGRGGEGRGGEGGGWGKGLGNVGSGGGGLITLISICDGDSLFFTSASSGSLIPGGGWVSGGWGGFLGKRLGRGVICTNFPRFLFSFSIPCGKTRAGRGVEEAQMKDERGAGGYK